ncbi:sigma factor-like helix-turn-helix DNA-binding protein [Jeotgalibacillus haloalkalitolerans]|uniref:Sigma factor-like helix-turn-helix DNA-binding protein n=1 Tax=Jeotgalibacillus haloalkalitolerans TaxID=3104292 RepID=A0ABU5KLW7_9BACL|nr:sigma factor-like helix-turn-helix DNA-binding protein [Jeotgalibacillus sp. HH7-29]MDZ5712253.1 sigma factor-like helix-turn-helix DNA-binding protein [Jeotgalibacillus sp. HH7-29]
MQTWVEQLIEEYAKGKYQLIKYRESLDMKNPANADEHRIVSGMISDMEYSLQWMRKGRRPYSRRGVDRRANYQRTALLDMDLFPSLNLEVEESVIPKRERDIIIDLLMDMSYRERECYLLHMAQGCSMAEIADELNITKPTVQTHIFRAKRKVRRIQKKLSIELENVDVIR